MFSVFHNDEWSAARKEHALQSAQYSPMKPFGRRASGRQTVDLPVSYFFADGITRAGRIKNVSSGGIFIEAAIAPDQDEVITIYTELLGLIEAKAIRSTVSGFAVKLSPIVCPLDPSDVALNRQEEISFKRNDNGDWVHRLRGSLGFSNPQFGLVPTRCDILSLSSDCLEIKTADDLGQSCDMRIGNFLGHGERSAFKKYRVVTLAKGHTEQATAIHG